MKNKIINKILNNNSSNPTTKDVLLPKDFDEYELDTMQPIAFNNIVCMYISMAHLKLEHGINSVEELMNKHITYGIVLPNNKWYFGHTGDVGERVHTHIKNARSKMSDFFKDFRDFGKGIFTVLKICETEEDSIYWETKLITQYKKAIFEKKMSAPINEYSNKEINKIVKEKIYNIKNY